MKVGDKLYCCNIYLATTKYSANVNWLNITIGRSYVIHNCNSVNNRIFFICDDGSSRWVESVYENSYWYYGKWFYTLKELRKVKLDILRSSSLIERSFICEAIIGMDGLE